MSDPRTPLPDLFVEAKQVLAETGLTPQDLRRQRQALRDALKVAQSALAKCARPTQEDLQMPSRQAWMLCVEAESKARTTLTETEEPQ